MIGWIAVYEYLMSDLCLIGEAYLQHLSIPNAHAKGCALTSLDSVFRSNQLACAAGGGWAAMPPAQGCALGTRFAATTFQALGAHASGQEKIWHQSYEYMYVSA
jgi:hypothetical protein